jgi:hypothetical protein
MTTTAGEIVSWKSFDELRDESRSPGGPTSSRGSRPSRTSPLNRGFGDGLLTYFGEVVVPIRFKDDDLGDTQTSVGLGVHIGVGF